MTIALKCLMKLKLNFFTEFIFKYVIPCRDSELRPDLTEGSTFKSSKKIQAAVKSGKFILIQILPWSIMNTYLASAWNWG